MSISASAVLVELNVSVWPARIVDKEMTERVNAGASAVRNASETKKNLFAGTSLRKDIEKYAARVRLFHNKYTLPWADKGERLCPTSLFLSYKAEINSYEQNFWALCNMFFDKYTTLVAQAPLHLGSLYKAEDYPALDDVKAKFGFRSAANPLPSSGDFRLDIPASDLLELQQEYDRKFEERVGDAMHSAWERLFSMLNGMSEKLTDNGDTEDKKRRWHDSFITNPQELCGLLTKLNITNDPRLEEARRQLELTMLGADIETIKESADARVEMKSKVDGIINKFNEWM